MDDFTAFIKDHPKSSLAEDAKFGVANCLEELDQLDAAYRHYEALLNTYPSPNVIRIKMTRIRERNAQKKR
jgi:TolA-binding protein